MKDTEFKDKLFNRGWKQDLFNTEGQMWKQIFAVAVIFLLLQTSLTGVIMSNEKSFACVVLTYSIVCLATFFNMTQIRDFEAIAVNFTPVALAIAGGVSIISNGATFSNVGMTFALVADSYFGIRYTEDSDEIEFNLMELFSRESWTQQAFERMDSLALQIGASFIIFTQLFLTTMGAISHHGYCAIFLAFYIARLSQFVGKTVFGVQMLQSNMTAVVLAVLAMFSLGSGVYATLATIILALDAYIGLALFTAKNSKKINATLKGLRAGGLIHEDEEFVRV